MTTGGKPHRASLLPLRCPVAFRTVPCPPEPVNGLSFKKHKYLLQLNLILCTLEA